MVIRCVWEHNEDDTLLYAVDYIGAYTRGPNREIAIGKMRDEIISYLDWIGESLKPESEITVEIVQEKTSELNIADADTDVLFDSEAAPLSEEEYKRQKLLVLKSAIDFHALYLSVPDKDVSCLPHRKTFYAQVPRTANEMYEHTKNVNSCYFGEIGVAADNDGTIYECRKRGFELLEQLDDFLSRPVVAGSYGELWSLRKVLRRFIWHDRIHAKAMYRMATKTFDGCAILNPFKFRI